MPPSTLTLEHCLQLLSMNKDNAFELDAFVILPIDEYDEKLSTHDVANGLCDKLAKALDYHWK